MFRKITSVYILIIYYYESKAYAYFSNTPSSIICLVDSAISRLSDRWVRAIYIHPKSQHHPLMHHWCKLNKYLACTLSTIDVTRFVLLNKISLMVLNLFNANHQDHIQFLKSSRRVSMHWCCNVGSFNCYSVKYNISKRDFLA